MNILHGIRAPSGEGGRMSSMGSSRSNSNYATWSVKMKTLLLQNRVWDLVLGTRVRPNPAPAPVMACRAVFHRVRFIRALFAYNNNRCNGILLCVNAM